jgi:origin recognition complex subunit 2
MHEEEHEFKEQPGEELDDYPDRTDFFEALKLRFKFTHFGYTFLWICLQQAGWTYRNTKFSSTGYQYQSPGEDGPAFDSWDLLVEYFDQFSLPDVHSNLQSTTTQEDFMTLEEKESGRNYRRLAMEKIFEHSTDTVWKKARKGAEEVCREEPTTANLKTTMSTDVASQRSVRGCGKISSTQTDAGTELYLHGNKPVNARRKGSSAAVASSSVAAAIHEAQLALPSLPELTAFLQANGDIHGSPDKEEAYKKSFSYWRFLLSTNHSLLFFGAGSKYSLLTDFCNQELSSEGYVLQIDGFDKDISMNSLLDVIVARFFGGREPESYGRSIRHDGSHNVVGETNPWRASEFVERAILISRAYAYEASETLLPLFIVIHNLEGLLLRNKPALEALSALVVNSNVENNVHAIRVVASIDHVAVNDVLFTTQAAANFAWVYQAVHTQRAYTKELGMLFDPTKRATKCKTDDVPVSKVKRVEEVLESLAPRHTEVIQVLAQMQLELTNDDEWVRMPVFRKQCKQQQLVAKDAQLDNYLNELLDHRLIEIDVRNERGDFIRAPFGRPQLHRILTFQRGQCD